MRIPLDRQSGIPLYQQIGAYLRQAILSGNLTADTRLPACRQLAHDLGVNRTTVENAYAELEADGLVFSRNSVTAQLIGEVGADKVATLAQRLGVRESPLEAVPSLALGTSPVSLLEMASAYASIAAQGEYRAPLLVTQVSDANGKPLMQLAPPPGTSGERVMDPAVAVQLIELLRGAVNRGTGQGIRSAWGITADVAGKTGTTQNNTDGWFILMQPQLVAGAWVGFNDARVTLRGEYWGQGAHNALNVVGDAMRAALAQRLVDERAEFPTPPGAGLRDFFRSAGEALKRWFGGAAH